jgi:hypothetical protein
MTEQFLKNHHCLEFFKFCFLLKLLMLLSFFQDHLVREVQLIIFFKYFIYLKEKFQEINKIESKFCQLLYNYHILVKFLNFFDYPGYNNWF